MVAVNLDLLKTQKAPLMGLFVNNNLNFNLMDNNKNEGQSQPDDAVDYYQDLDELEDIRYGAAGNFIKVYIKDILLFGGINEAIMYERLYRWAKKGKDPDGWVYKTKAEMRKETTLPRTTQDRARKNLQRLGVLDVINKKPLGHNAPKLHYRMNKEGYKKLLLEGVWNDPKRVNPNDPKRVNPNDPKRVNPLYTTEDDTTEDTILLDQFEKFWKEYPKKVAKKATIKLWEKLKPEQDQFNAIIKGVKDYKKTKQWIQSMADDKRHIPHPTTFLNQERYYDEIVPNKEIQQRPVRTVLPERQQTERQREKNTNLRTTIKKFTQSLRMKSPKSPLESRK